LISHVLPPSIEMFNAFTAAVESSIICRAAPSSKKAG
jgi:hypothetical protein